MAPVRRRRRLPTLIDRGLGLLEVILPSGAEPEAPALPLPEGRRDETGFWFPARFRRPSEIFTVQQRRLQAKQREVQRRRRVPDRVSAPKPAQRMTAAPDAAGCVSPGEVSVPLPPPLCEAMPRARQRSSPCPRPLPGAMLNPPIGTGRPEPGRPATRVPLVVDSGKASD
jgi:hypothetical protein